jgi:hypothetical protein
MPLTRRQVLTRALIGAGATFVATVVLFLGPLPEPSRTFMNQRRAAVSIQSVIVAQRNFDAQHPDSGFACSLEELASTETLDDGSAPGIDRLLASGEKAGYDFDIRCDASAAGRAARYTVTAVPTQPGVTGNWAICSDQRGQIWFSPNGSASDCLGGRRLIDLK